MRSSSSARRNSPCSRSLLVERLEGRVVPSFFAARAFDAGWNSVAVGEFNGDGRPDLATVRPGSVGAVSVLLGNGDGSFQAARTYSAGPDSRTVAVGEFNGDGRQDLVVANRSLLPCSAGSVSVLLGNGDGTFQNAQNFSAGIRSEFVTVGEFNGDSRQDLAVTNYCSATVVVLLGNGDGSFQNPQSIPAGSLPTTVKVGEFNGDGYTDLVVTNSGSVNGTVSVLLGNGDGSFRARLSFPVGANPGSVAVEEFNGDGRQDLVVANFGVSPSEDTVVVLLGNGDGTFQDARQLNTRGGSVAVGEFNGDGRQDLAVANGGVRPSEGTVSVLLGNGDGTFQDARIVRAGSTPTNVAVADVNGDGRHDLAVVNSDVAGSTMIVLVGNGDGSFPDARHFPAGASPYSVAVGDFNRDGRPDLATANLESANVSVLLGNGNGSFQAARNFSSGNRPRSVAVGDFNGDGRQDLVTANNTNPGTVSVLLGNGDGTFQNAQNFLAGTYPHSVAVADVNGDGRQDLAVTNLESANVSVFLGNGDGTFQNGMNFEAGARPVAVAVADFNRDDRLDLVTGNFGFPFTMSLLLGNGDGSFQAPRQFGAGGNSRSVVVGDLNGDSRLDLAVANYSDNVSVMLGNGDGSFQAAQNFPAGSRATSVALGDFNADGLPDLAVVSSGTVRVLVGNGDGTFQPTNGSYVAGRGPQFVAVADFDGDNFADLAVANSNSNDVSVLLNKPVEYFYPWPDFGTVTAGAPFDLYVLALDGSFNLVPQYTGQIWFWTSDPLAMTPELYRFQPSDQGIASFPGGITLRTPGTQYVLVFDTSTFQVIGYGVYEVVAAGPGRAGGFMPDLFAGQQLASGQDTLAARPVVAEAIPEPSRSAVDPAPTSQPAPAGTSPAARPARLGAPPPALLDHLFAKLDDHWLAT